MVTLHSTRFGTIEVEEADILTFPQGILGFEQVKQYAVLNPQQEGPFRILQGVDESDLAFVVVDPRVCDAQYQVGLSLDWQDELGVESGDASEILTYAIVTIPQKVEEMTANLQAPVVVNRQTGLAKQVVLAGDRYSIRHRMLPQNTGVTSAEGETASKASPRSPVKSRKTSTKAVVGLR